MSFPRPFDIATGSAHGWRSIKVDGRATNVAQSYVPVSAGLIYRTPQPSGAVNLRVWAGGNANDTASGSGARSIMIYGLDANGLEISETVATAGASASAATTQQFIRLTEARVASSGTYATQSAGSHAGDIVIEDTGGNAWGTITLNGFPEGVSRIGAYTIPANYEAFLIGFRVNADTGKTCDAMVFKRSGILDTAPPYQPMEAVVEVFNATGFIDLGYDAPIYLPPLTDVGVLAKVDVQTARVGVGLGLLMRRV